MCSIDEGDLEDIRSKEEADRLKSSAVTPSGRPMLCQKCREEPAVLLLRVNDIYCRGCFLAAVTHKFRSTLGKSRLLKPGERALLAFSGGPASCVLARLLRDGLDQPGSRQLRLQPHLLHVDESTLLAGAAPASVLQLAAEYDVPVYRAALEWVLTPDGAPVAEPVHLPPERVTHAAFSSPDVSQGETPQTATLDGAQQKTASTAGVGGETPADSEQLRQRLLQLWEAAGSTTAREQLLARLRGELLARAARQLDCHLLLLAETETRLAVRLLADLAGGRGAHAHQLTALADERHSGLLLLRPLRELSAKQVALFAHHRGVPFVAGGGLDTLTPADASVDRATEAFVQGLQADFPATVSTVYRTGTKLAAVGALAADCALCRLPLDTGGGAASALQATRFSQLVSASGPATFDPGQLASAAAVGTTLPSVGAEGSSSLEDSRCSGEACCGEECGSSGSCVRGGVARPAVELFVLRVSADGQGHV
ncbi:cytoplasmic tRNA 2-thiolation protein 2-A-like [Pollicipes pollicipes]|uniref:cytoplasmic tRNA 2-thiolation protein 2-A-like n=1 Tax=Pollicipes pollicipes TaxID=41117 RepID=UPI0018854B80|nr:cytoplasmic tRNA 2-thiolation protein 2-A-like [Pollicipes pollicipes]XP_037083224.1 cytoplasmic tRNA 2-thiolation protein 2-A-like [Pollicipes pollicipes]